MAWPRSCPRTYPASLFIALHTLPTHQSTIAELLSERGPLPASHPLHGEKIALSRIYVASPDTHLLVREGSMEVVRGAKENGHWPAASRIGEKETSRREGD